ncbi:hypothetical protein QAD02_000013 [Eretmocerus hayati]|uniref:Uncharacterized protein n=1 Tax=Eretmocerus hayati TaxID=131215 RepID=A0ACC2NBZ0_9HYME|nr:hypothetical protein QAD02_000013 [Eretmocerus hayati]
MAETSCSICLEPLLKRDRLTQKPLQITDIQSRGLSTFIQKSKIVGDGKENLWKDRSKICVHEKCRLKYKNIQIPQPGAKRARLSFNTSNSSQDSALDCSQDSLADSLGTDSSHHFDFPDKCFICGGDLDRNHKKVQTSKKDSISKLCSAALDREDDFGKNVYDRIHNLNARDRIQLNYHTTCYDSFRYKKNRSDPIVDELSHEISVVQNDESSETEAFEVIYSYIESSEKYAFSLQELQDIAKPVDISNYRMEKQLKSKYGERMYIHRKSGKTPEVYFKPLNLSNIYDFWWFDKDSLSAKERSGILDVACKILRQDILSEHYDTASYPPPNYFMSYVTSEIPESVKNFLGKLMASGSGKRKKNLMEEKDRLRKCNTVAHTIITTLRPKTFISKLHLSTATYIYRKTGSKLIITALSNLGVSATYYSLQLYEASLIMDPPRRIVGQNVQLSHVYDNTDHNVRTYNGYGTYHCLGGVAIYTPEHQITYVGSSKKLTRMPPASVLASRNVIKTRIFEGTIDSDVLRLISFESVQSLGISDPPKFPNHYVAYILAKKLELPFIPLWKGYMAKLSDDKTVDQSHIVCLPFINLPPSKWTTLYTAIWHAMEQTRELGQRTTILTFDQPLHYKACLLAAWIKIHIFSRIPRNPSLKKPVLLINLGALHITMSYMGSMSYVMLGSGLEDMWYTVYAQESVKKMLTGHSYARAVRAHILSFTAISLHLCKSLNLPDIVNREVQTFFRSWDKNYPEIDDMHESVHIGDCNNELFNNVSQLLVDKMESVARNNPTAKLWIQYLNSVIVCLMFIESERLGNWTLLLQSMKSMLPLLHASGHFAYAKSLQIYIQDLVNLELVMDEDEYRRFTEDEYHTYRRTDARWSGCSGDRIIESILNRLFGIYLKHGRGSTESVVARYFATMPAACIIMEQFEEYCGLKTISSEQHVEVSKSIMSRDDIEIKKFEYWLENHNPFQPRSSLTSVSTGIIASGDINCHLAIETGTRSMETMVGKTLDNISLSKDHKVKPISLAKEGLHVSNDAFFNIDNSLLFDRVFHLFKSDIPKTKEALQYELARYPMSLFDNSGVMRKPTKSDLYRCFEPCLKSELATTKFLYVIDGGWLLHQISWPHSTKFSSIFEIYKNYIINRFGREAIVIFDGYSNEIIGTKSYERYRRREKNVGADIEIDDDRLCSLHQKQFLLNIANKYKFVHKLSSYLQGHGLEVSIAAEDADAFIVSTAIRIKREKMEPVAIVGNDVDLLVLSVAMADDEIFFLKKSTGKNPQVLYSTSRNNARKSYILFAHAFAGCDTTSALFNQGKLQIVSLLENDAKLREEVAIFMKPNQNKIDLFAAASSMICNMYNVKKFKLINPTINELRYEIFKTSSLKRGDSLAHLPPTESTLQQHTYRVYYQIQSWLGYEIRPEDWGWVRTQLMLIPILNLDAPAPEDLLAQVFCNCTGDCSSNRCTCKKAGLLCTIFVAIAMGRAAIMRQNQSNPILITPMTVVMIVVLTMTALIIIVNMILMEPTTIMIVTVEMRAIVREKT